jgi:hypothetical protein
MTAFTIQEGRSARVRRTRTSNPLFGLRNVKYSMFQAVSSFREWQEGAVLGAVVTSVVTKRAEAGMLFFDISSLI